ncbi:MAG: NUDIX domain-containing protein [Thermoguttaceae bacterium]|jgi:8-oxo-dGTP diphosphatase
MTFERIFEQLRKPAMIAAWLYFIFMCYMLFTPLPPLAIIPEFTFDVIHFLGFLVLGALIGLARSRWSVSVWIAILIGWGVASECIQPITGRVFEYGDILEDALGTTAGLVLISFVRWSFVDPSKNRDKSLGGAVALLFRPPFSLDNLDSLDLAERQVLVIRRSDKVIAPGALCFPGGGIEKGETPADAAVREFREEVGLDIRVGEIVAENTTPGGAPLYWLVAELADPNDLDPEIRVRKEEVASCEWLTLSELLAAPGFLPNNHAIVTGILKGEIALKGRSN